MNELRMKLRGHVKAVLRGPDGRTKQIEESDNLIVTVGRDGIVDQLKDSPTIVKPSHMAVGTGTVAPAAGDTALGTEIDRNALTSKNRTNNVLTMVGDWAAGDGTGAITEAGVFSQASGTDGTHPMYARATFSVINKAAGDTLQITWTFTLTVS